jgi:hypothetical protein
MRCSLGRETDEWKSQFVEIADNPDDLSAKDDESSELNGRGI